MDLVDIMGVMAPRQMKAETSIRIRATFERFTSHITHIPDALSSDDQLAFQMRPRRPAVFIDLYGQSHWNEERLIFHIGAYEVSYHEVSFLTIDHAKRLGDKMVKTCAETLEQNDDGRE